MKSDKIKMLCLFDYGKGVNTGYATVSRNLVKEWKKHYKERLILDIVAINYFGKPYLEDEITAVDNAYFSEKSPEEGIKFPEKINDKVKNDEFGRLKFLKNLKDNDYDIIFILNDLGVVCSMAKAIQQIKEQKKKANRKSFKSVFYFPVDSHVFPQVSYNLEVFDKLVTYTEFGKRELLNVRPHLANKTSIIPHGTNIKDFFPVENAEMQIFRKEYFGENANKFIIGNINRNQPRKDIPATIFGFLRFKEQHKDSLLYLHMNPKDPLGYDLPAIFAQTPLKEGEDYMFPPKGEDNHALPVEKLNLIYNSLNCYITTNRGEGWGLCLSSKSKVLTINGTKEIKDIKIGDEVLTNSGKFELVLDTTTRKIESYIEVKTKYGYLVEATHEHPYYSLVNGKEGYRNISQLKKGDYLAIVKQNHSITNKGLSENSLDLFEYLSFKVNNWEWDDKYIYNKWGYSPNNKKWSIANICINYATTKKVVENAIAFITGKKQKVSEASYRLANNLIADGFDKPKPLKINRHINLNDNVLWMFGWYLAEGSCEGGKRIEFSMGRDEIEYANRIAEIIKENFGIKDVIVRVYQNKCAVRVSSVTLALLFKEIFGNGAFNKRIPEFLFEHPKSLMPLVDGYIKGDGHINLNNDTINFSTISPSLVYQIQSVLVTNGIMLSVNKTKRDGKCVIYTCAIPLTHLRKYMDMVGIKGKLDREGKRNHKPEFIETNTHFFVPIISIKEIKKEDEFYDLCVQNSHSFVANGLVCHNTVSEAMRCKIPVIAPLHTSIDEISKDGKNIWGLEELDLDCTVTDNIIRYKCMDFEVEEKLNSVYSADKRTIESKVNGAFNYISSITWDYSAKKFIEIFNTLL